MRNFHDPLSRWESRGIAVFFVGILLFGAIVEMRGAFLQRRMNDLTVYLRAAWAVRSGADLYTMTDEKGFHYLYPPLFAIVMVPLADPPPGADRSGAIPFAISVGVWYLLSWLFLALGMHSLGKAMEHLSPDMRDKTATWRTRGWWILRLWPVLICLPQIGNNLSHGQINLLLLALLCAMAAAAIRGNSQAAGLWLAGAICLHVIPAYLLLYPLWRRDYRWLASCALGCVLGLWVIPGVAIGPKKTLEYNVRYIDIMLRPAVSEGGDKDRLNELHGMTATDNQSPLAVWHQMRYWHLKREARPPYPDFGTRLAHYLFGAFLTASVLAAAGRRRSRSAAAEVLFIGLLSGHMLVVSPFAHSYHFTLVALPVAGMLAHILQAGEANRFPAGWKILFTLYILGTALPLFDSLEALRFNGMAMYSWLVLAAAGTVMLWRSTQCPSAILKATPG